ncbi:ABC transporter ATP-binding protein [Lactococcus garvieae]|uniref:ABC transporter ATP-binding protein n=1 Tax=Lactococcus garvieae TaxID=1363 RepID=UPI0009C0DCB4|nr:ABC transporter ATP-binding protein [Lactococcus garvieae]
MAKVVSIKNLSVGFDGREVLENLSLELFSGQIIGLIGPSGSGKSTFINALLGMIKTDAGEIKILNTRIPNREIMNEIGFMAQSDALFSELTGQQNMEFFGALQGKIGKEKMRQAAATVGLTTELSKTVAKYSGGMKRRLSLAIALQTDAPILLLDEPTVGIDPELRQTIWSELKRQAERGKAILMTTHVMDEAERCDQVILLRAGKFVAQGSPAELKNEFHVSSIEEAFIQAGQAGDSYES